MCRIFEQVEDGAGELEDDEMARYLASVSATCPEQAKDFDWSRYRFDEDRSSEDCYVFAR